MNPIPTSLYGSRLWSVGLGEESGRLKRLVDLRVLW
jgi:hypothetical protein